MLPTGLKALPCISIAYKYIAFYISQSVFTALIVSFIANGLLGITGMGRKKVQSYTVKNKKRVR